MNFIKQISKGVIGLFKRPNSYSIAQIANLIIVCKQMGAVYITFTHAGKIIISDNELEHEEHRLAPKELNEYSVTENLCRIGHCFLQGRINDVQLRLADVEQVHLFHELNAKSTVDNSVIKLNYNYGDVPC